MASSIGQGVYGQPTAVPIPNSEFSGSTSGIGGQSTESVQKYDPTYGFSFLYVPGSKMFSKVGGYTYNGPTGNWGRRMLQKVNLRKQVSGAAGYLAADPLARTKHTKFITMNYGLQEVNPFLPRGGSVPRVIGVSDVEDPRAFYSDYNWGNPQQRHETPAGEYYTIPENDPETKDTPDPARAPPGTPRAPPGTPQDDPNNPQIPREQRIFEHLNPMAGRNGMGFDPVLAAAVTQQLNNLTGGDDEWAGLNNHIPGADDYARRRAATITQTFNDPSTQILHENDGAQTTNLTGSVGTSNAASVASGGGGLSGIESRAGGPGELRSETTGEALPALASPPRKSRASPPPPVPPPRSRRRSRASTQSSSGRPRSQRRNTRGSNQDYLFYNNP